MGGGSVGVFISLAVVSLPGRSFRCILALFVAAPGSVNVICTVLVHEGNHAFVVLANVTEQNKVDQLIIYQKQSKYF